MKAKLRTTAQKIKKRGVLATWLLASTRLNSLTIAGTAVLDLT